MHQPIQFRNSIPFARNSISRAPWQRGFAVSKFLIYAAVASRFLFMAPSGSCENCKKSDPCEKKQGYSVDVFSGNVDRSGIIDLEIWGAVGQIPMKWERMANSNVANAQTVFGNAHNWRHSWEWEMEDEGLDAEGHAQLAISFPNGEYIVFIESTPGVWETPLAFKKRLFQDGNNFYVQYPDGQRCRFEKLTDDNGTDFYQLQDIRDAEQNLFVLSYETTGEHRLLRVTEPAGRFFDITYGLVGTFSVITRVSTSDGRSVNYTYEIIDHGGGSFVALSAAVYGDGTSASYSYSQSHPGAGLFLAHAIDPRLNGPATNMKYTYADNSGFVSQELNGVTGQAMFTLTVGGDDFTATYGNGDVKVLNYKDKLLLNSLVDGLSRVTSFKYNADGFVIQTVDALGRVTKYTKTLYDNPLRMVKPDNSKEIWTRDDLDLPLTHTDELGRVTTYTRDANHRVTRIDYPDGTFETFTYNDFSEVIEHQRKNGGVEYTTYDTRGLKLSFQDADGNVTAPYTYDSADRLASITDARGNTTQFEYNERGLLTRVINPDPQQSYKQFFYDDFGNRTMIVDELRHTWTTSYDEFRRMVDVTDPLGRVTHYDYDLPGGICGCTHTHNEPTKITLPSGLVTTIEYDVEWQKTSQTVGFGSADAATTQYQYDLVGNQTHMIDPRVHDWVTEYDVRDRKHAFTDPLGNRTQWDYDRVGNIVKITRPDRGITTNKFDSMNRLIRTTDPKGEVTKMAYDSEGNMATLTDARNNQYQYTYDLLNRELSLIYPDTSHEDWTWDPVSNLATYTIRAGQVRTYVYDNRNRETDSGWNDGSTPAISRTYDAASRLLTMNSSVSSLTYDYTDANELKSETQDISGVGSAKSVAYTYNLDGLRDTLTYPDGTIVSYSYTGRNQISTISDGGSSDPLVSYSYDPNGNRIGKALENGTSTGYDYDDANRMTHIAHQNGVSVFASFAYVYDSVDRRTSVTREDATMDSFGYDAIDQVGNVQYGANGRSVGYLYDKVGNRTSVTDNGATTRYWSNSLSEYAKVGGTSLAYDTNGNLVTAGGWKYTYDAQNRLISASKGANTATFSYDSRNRRIKQTINGATVLFYFNGWSLIDERDASDVQQARYVRGGILDEILSKTSPREIVYYHHDSIGNTVQLTDNSGAVVERYSYDVFGSPTVKDGIGNVVGASAFGNRFLFAGREFTSELKLYDYRNRFFSPELGRFLQPDPLRFDAGDNNLYRYVGNNPINKLDALGLKWDVEIIWYEVPYLKFDECGNFKGIRYEEHFVLVPHWVWDWSDVWLLFDFIDLPGPYKMELKWELQRSLRAWAEAEGYYGPVSSGLD